ncbi:uncharacterized protein LOC119525875 [Choloepus didactylus]|uniref:uncharacterized protein LOC119525875 n=1 Tax=Choloepus didactylus TaxID=27675 RepID=UPI00189EBB75|nr:uncharacterized protein LOC119525875 [Choloepus didactylus]
MCYELIHVMHFEQCLAQVSACAGDLVPAKQDALQRQGVPSRALLAVWSLQTPGMVLEGPRNFRSEPVGSGATLSSPGHEGHPLPRKSLRTWRRPRERGRAARRTRRRHAPRLPAERGLSRVPKLRPPSRGVVLSRLLPALWTEQGLGKGALTARTVSGTRSRSARVCGGALSDGPQKLNAGWGGEGSAGPRSRATCFQGNPVKNQYLKKLGKKKRKEKKKPQKDSTNSFIGTKRTEAPKQGTRETLSLPITKITSITVDWGRG